MVKFSDFLTAESVAKALQGEIKGKTVLITGVTQGGYGAEVARVLALVGANVILAGRSIDKIRETARVIKKETPTAEFRELVVDLGSQKSVRQAAAQVLEFPEPIDVLMLNAGIMATPYGKTPEGLEVQFGTNHIGNFLFTNLIISKLLETPSPRVVSVASMGHTWGNIRYDVSMFRFIKDLDFGDGKDYDKWAAYAQSKTANILFAVELAERYKDKNFLAFSLDPGASATSLQQYMTKEDFIRFHYAYHPDGRPKGDWLGTVQENSATHIVAGFDPSIADQSGSYLVKCQVTTDPEDLRPYACDTECAKKLWALSEEIVGQKFDL